MGSVVVAYDGVGWYLSGEIIDGMKVTAPVVEYDTDVLAVTDTQITVSVSDEEAVPSDQDAVMGLRWDGGYGQVGPAKSSNGLVSTAPSIEIAGDTPTARR